MIVTKRLTLIPATVELLRAEIGDHVELARLLSAAVPDNWPPETTVDALPFFLDCVESSPDQIGWFGWYAVTTTDPATLIGGGGFMGPPKDSAVQSGYSVIEQYQRQGYATEMVNSLIKWAFSQSQCERVIAETEWANPASARVLNKIGFASVGAATTPGGARFELVVSSSGE